MKMSTLKGSEKFYHIFSLSHRIPWISYLLKMWNSEVIFVVLKTIIGQQMFFVYKQPPVSLVRKPAKYNHLANDGQVLRQSQRALWRVIFEM